MVKTYNDIVKIVIAHISAVTCVIGLVRFTHYTLQATQPELTIMKLGTLAYWIGFLLRWSHMDNALVFSY